MLPHVKTPTSEVYPNCEAFPGFMQNKKNYHVRHIPMAESVRGEGAVVRASSVAGEGAVSLESSSYPTDKFSADES